MSGMTPCLMTFFRLTLLISLSNLIPAFFDSKSMTQKFENRTEKSVIRKNFSNFSFMNDLKYLYSPQDRGLLSFLHTSSSQTKIRRKSLLTDLEENIRPLFHDVADDDSLDLFFLKNFKHSKSKLESSTHNSKNTKEQKKQQKKVKFKEKSSVKIQEQMVKNLKSEWFTEYLKSIRAKLKKQKCIENGSSSIFSSSRSKDKNSLTLREGLKMMQLLEILKDLEVTKEEYNKIRDENKKLIALNNELKHYTYSDNSGPDLDNFTDSPDGLDEINQTINRKANFILEKLNNMITLLNESHSFDFPVEETKVRKNPARKTSTTSSSVSYAPITDPTTTTTTDACGTCQFVAAWLQYSKDHTIPVRTTTILHFNISGNILFATTPLTTSPINVQDLEGCPAYFTKCPLNCSDYTTASSTKCNSRENNINEIGDNINFDQSQKINTTSEAMEIPSTEEDSSEDLQNIYLLKCNQQKNDELRSTRDSVSSSNSYSVLNTKVTTQQFDLKGISHSGNIDYTDDDEDISQFCDINESHWASEISQDEAVSSPGLKKNTKVSSLYPDITNSPITAYVNTERSSDFDALTQEDEVPFDYFLEDGEGRSAPRRSYFQADASNRLLPGQSDLSEGIYMDSSDYSVDDSHAIYREHRYLILCLLALEAIFFYI